MPKAEPATPVIEILPPDGHLGRPERRRAPVFRPYGVLDGRPPGQPAAPADRRRRRRAMAEQGLGRRVDLES